ncbi:ferredoxin reductase family protein [Vibrio rhodolitus]|uniref:ferredoxin reductase family protein n=1 Tax=Vibrio rhodolitus TaxID=2231649 RepID=UPI000E0A4311|nr:ferredoxin reductase family protein [Vibrio rhodolitus]
MFKLSPVFKAVLIGVVVSIGLWFLLPQELELARKIPAYFATVSMMSMSAAIVISCRPKWLDKALGGIDKAYVWHKWLGIAGLLGASFHWLLVPGPAGNSAFPAFTEFGEEMGQWAVYGLLLIGGVSMVRRLPYRIWFYTHKLMAPIFLVSVYHTFFSDVPFELTTITGLSLALVSLVGIAGIIYKSFLVKKSYKQYQVVEVRAIGDAVAVQMVPINDAIDYEVGQFAYLDFGFEKIEHFHPFTIVSNPENKNLSFIIRNLGQHTAKLQTELKVGQMVTVDGGYGQLSNHKKDSKPQVWIAGGIGITPFVAWLSAKTSSEQEIHLFYMGRGEFYESMSEWVKKECGKVGVQFYSKSDLDRRLDASVIKSKLNNSISEYQMFGCGPVEMLEDIKQGLVKQGMQEEQWHNENFVMR